jgi:RimJ/RimL family protein N-acetyltransferase
MDVPSIQFPDPPLTDGAIAVRGLIPDDAEEFSRIARDPSIAHDAYHDMIEMSDPDAVRAYIERGVSRAREGSQVLLAATDAAGGLVGQTMLFGFDHPNASAELGFWVAPDARGRGIAVAEVRLTCSWAFDELKLERIWAMTTPQNVAAQAAMERAGFTREGTLRGFERTEDGRWDLVSFGLLATDPR